MNTLYDLCKAKGYKVLFLSNRILLKEQIQAEYYEKIKDVITVHNYQYFSERVKYNSFHNMYDVIVADECHWFFSDSTFANETDIPLKYLTENADRSMIIFLSATSGTLKEYLNSNSRLDFTYEFMKPYCFNQCYYWNDIDVIKKFLISLPENEKAIYFCGSVERAYKLQKEFIKNSTFLCSKNNSKYGELSDQKTMNEIRNTESFSSQILFTTSVLDNGINLHDSKLKHIITDIYDFETIVQCLGRKRISDETDLPNIYIKQKKQPAVQTIVNNIHKKIKPLNCFSTDFKNFDKKYGRKNKYGLLYTVCDDVDKQTSRWEINVAKKMKYEHDLKLAEEINKLDMKFGHLIYLCECLEIDFSKFEDMELYYTKITLEDRLNQFLNIPLYGKDKSQFIEMLKKDVLRPLQGGYKQDTINRYFNNIGLPYYIETKHEQSRKSKFYGKRSWILKLKKSKMEPQ
jgi:hypothetical protein